MPEWLEQFQHFHFLRPWWLLGLVVAVIAALVLRRRRADAGQWRDIIAPRLQPFLLDGADSDRRPALHLWIFLALALASLGLAGPTWQQTPLPVHKQEGALVVLFDLSPSMVAEDIAPNRLIRARLKLMELLKRRREGTTALVVFSGDAHVVTPLTDDTDTIASQVPALHPNIMPVVGSYPDIAVDRGLELARNAGHDRGDLLLITDGMTSRARENIEQTLRNNTGFRLSILGVGSEDGAPIPLADGGYARDSSGDRVIARLRGETLRGLAERQRGRYSRLTADNRDLDFLMAPFNDRRDGEMRELERRFDTWHDLGYWLALLLLPLALLAFRRGLLAALLLTPLLHSPPAQASWWDALWLTPDQRGHKALKEDDPERAAQLFEDKRWQGIAAYRGGDYGSAAEAFADSGGPRGHYNRGNALARAGELEAAIAAYDQALALDPEMADAAHNKKIVEELQRQRQESRDQGEDSDDGDRDGSRDNQDKAPEDRNSEGDQPESNQQPADDSPQDNAGNQSPGDQGDPPQSDQDGSSQQDQNRDPDTGPEQAPETEQAPEADTGQSGAAADELDEEEQQLMEQRLRQVPDDPGGLLRRKFLFEAQQRRMEGRRHSSPPAESGQEERW